MEWNEVSAPKRRKAKSKLLTIICTEKHVEEGEDEGMYGYDDGSAPAPKYGGAGAWGGSAFESKAPKEGTGFKGGANQASNIANYDYGVDDQDSDEEIKCKCFEY